MTESQWHHGLSNALTALSRCRLLLRRQGRPKNLAGDVRAGKNPAVFLTYFQLAPLLATMKINFDVNSFLSDKALIFRLTLLLLLFIIFISPGLIMIYLFNPELLTTLSDVKLLIFSAGVSIPLHLLALVLLISSPATQISIIKDPSQFRAYSISIGAMLWAVLWVFLLLALTKLIGYLYPSFKDLPQNQQIISAYIIALAFFFGVSIFSFLKVTIRNMQK